MKTGTEKTAKRDAAVRREWKTLLGEDAADGAAAGKTHSRSAAK